MSDTPRFTVIDRRKIKAEEELESQKATKSETEEAVSAAATPSDEPAPGPRLVVNEPKAEQSATSKEEEKEELPEMPPAPTAQESQEQKSAYDASSQRLNDLLRAQNPAMGAPPPIGFENLIQQFYLSAMIQMGAGTQEGQRPRVDIVGARNTIDLLGVLAEKTKGNLSAEEDQALSAILFELRMAFLELTRMISLQAVPPTPPPEAH
jgi:hypothetical protein